LLGPEHPDTLTAMNNLAVSYAKVGRWDETLKMREDVLALDRKALGSEHPDTLKSMNNLAMAYIHTKSYRKAEVLLRESLAIRQKAQPNMWTTYNTQYQLGSTLLNQKEYADAAPMLVGGYEGMKATQDQVPPSNRAHYPKAVDRIIDAYTALNESDEVKKWKAERAQYSAAVTQPVH
jgi:serine/threonine-protein kinase